MLSDVEVMLSDVEVMLGDGTIPKPASLRSSHTSNARVHDPNKYVLASKMNDSSQPALVCATMTSSCDCD